MAGPQLFNPISVVLQSKMIKFTRDFGVATGNVSYTGVGFKPRCLIAMGCNDAAATPTSIGFAGLDRLGYALWHLGILGVDWNGALANLIRLFTDPARTVGALADIVSFDNDGFTLSWTRIGAAAGVYDIMVLCLA